MRPRFGLYFGRRRLAGDTMAITIDPRHLQVGSHHRLSLIIAAILAFLLVALWSQPVG